MLLASYPRSWRQTKSDEVLGVMLDVAAGRTRPSPAEMVNLIGYGLRARMRILLGVVPDPVRLRIAQLALMTGGALSLTMITLGEVGIPGARPLFPLMDASPPGAMTLPPRLGPFAGLGAVVGIGWLGVLLAWLVGRAGLLRVAATITFAITILVPHLADVTNRQRPPLSLLVGLAMLTVAILIVPLRPMRGWTRFGPPLIAVLGGVGLVAWRLIALRHVGPHDAARSRTCFYWCTRQPSKPAGDEFLDTVGRGGSAAISHEPPYGLP
jgi:hypothetical protein